MDAFKSSASALQGYLDHRSNHNDKTASFHDMIKQKQFNTPLEKSFPIMKGKNKFLVLSSKVDFDLKEIDRLLDNLFKISQKSSLFNNEFARINDLIVTIKEKLSETQSQFNVVSSLTHDMMFNKQAESLANIVIDILQAKLVNITKKFREALQIRSEYIRKTEEKKNIFAISSNNGKKAFSSFKDDHPKLRNNLLFLNKSKPEEEKEEENDEENHENGRLIAKTDSGLSSQYFQTRMESMKNIEKMLHEVSGIFQRLGTMVKMHEVMIDRIDKNTDDTITYVEKGKKELFEHLSDIKSNRNLVLKVFLILLIFSIIYIIFSL